MKREDLFWTLVATVAVLALQVGTERYCTDATFRARIDGMVDRVRYQHQRGRWLTWLRSLPGWRREWWNHTYPLPPEFRETCPGSVWTEIG